MTKFATVALAALLATGVAIPAATPAFAVDTSISEKCGPDGPEAYKRPGGYCEQIGANQSNAAKGEHHDLFIVYIPFPSFPII